jgi:Zn finger protein HypA/HybF involved in hydrogenase expression
MIRIAFSTASQRAIERRATDMKGRIWCEQCGAECLSRADFEFDHVIPEGVRAGDRLALTADDGRLLCLRCHERKTKKDVTEIARAKRLSHKHRVIGSGMTEIARRFRVKQEEPER